MSFKTKYPAVYEKSLAGFDIHLSDAELSEFYSEAKKLAPKTVFTPKGCIECVNAMVKFVFDSEDKPTSKFKGIEEKQK